MLTTAGPLTQLFMPSKEVAIQFRVASRKNILGQGDHEDVDDVTRSEGGWIFDNVTETNGDWIYKLLYLMHHHSQLRKQ